MARTVGPLMSFDASGKLANTIVFSKWKGRPYVRQLVTPSNPKSALQVATRAMMKFLSQAWTPDLSDANKASYATPAHADSVSEFNAYSKMNMKLFTQFQLPSFEQPPLNVATLPTWTALPTATGGVGQATITGELNAPGAVWGLAVFRSKTTGFTVARDNMIGIVDLNSGTDPNYVDTPLLPGTWYYNFLAFANDGHTSAELGETSAVVS